MEFMEASIIATHKHQRGEVVYQVHRDIVDVMEKRETQRIAEVITNSVTTWSVLQNSKE